MAAGTLDYHPHRRPRVAIRRVVGAGLAVLFVAAAAFLGLTAWRVERFLRAAEATRPVAATVDLSVPGVTDIPVTATSALHGGVEYRVESANPPGDWRAALAGLTCKVERLEPTTGAAVGTKAFAGHETQTDPANGSAILGHGMRVGAGETLRLTIETPAAGAAGPVTFFASPTVCCERMGVAVPGMLAAAAGIGAAVCGGLTGWSVFRHGWRLPIR